MYVKVKRLRRHGERLSDHDISADQGTVGHMTVWQVEATIVAKLRATGDDSRTTAVIPELWRARVVAMNADKMLFEGFERIGDKLVPDAAMIRQEWAVQVMALAP